MDELNNKIKALEEKQDILSLSVNNYKTIEEELIERLDGLSAKIKDKKKEVTDFVEASNTRIASQKEIEANATNALKRDKNVEIAGIEKMKSEKLELAVTIGKIKEDIDEKNTELDTLVSKISSKKKDLEDLEKQYTEDDDLKKQSIKEIDEVISGLQRDIKDKSDKRLVLLKNIDELTISNDKLSKEAERFNSQILKDREELNEDKKKEESTESKRGYLIKLNEDIAELKKEAGVIRKQIDNNKEAIKQFKVDKFGVLNKEQELNQHIEMLKGVYTDFKLPW